MNVLLNGEPRSLDPDATLGGVIDGLGRSRKGLAVAVNEEVVPRSEWDATPLNDGDRVEVLTAAQGGCT